MKKIIICLLAGLGILAISSCRTTRLCKDSVPSIRQVLETAVEVRIYGFDQKGFRAKTALIALSESQSHEFFVLVKKPLKFDDRVLQCRAEYDFVVVDQNQSRHELSYACGTLTDERQSAILSEAFAVWIKTLQTKK